MSGTLSLALLVRMEDVVLRLHCRMARMSAVGEAFGIGRKLVRCRVVVEHRISPAAAFRKFLAVLFDHESLFKNVWHLDDEGRLRTLLLCPLQLRNLAAIRKGLPIARNAGLVSF